MIWVFLFSAISSPLCLSVCCSLLLVCRMFHTSFDSHEINLVQSTIYSFFSSPVVMVHSQVVSHIHWRLSMCVWVCVNICVMCVWLLLVEWCVWLPWSCDAHHTEHSSNVRRKKKKKKPNFFLFGTQIRFNFAVAVVAASAAAFTTWTTLFNALALSLHLLLWIATVPLSVRVFYTCALSVRYKRSVVWLLAGWLAGVPVCLCACVCVWVYVQACCSYSILSLSDCRPLYVVVLFTQFRYSCFTQYIRCRKHAHALVRSFIRSFSHWLTDDVAVCAVFSCAFFPSHSGAHTHPTTVVLLVVRWLARTFHSPFFPFALSGFIIHIPRVLCVQFVTSSVPCHTSLTIVALIELHLLKR